MVEINHKFIVAFQGEKGAYSDAAALEYFGPDIQTLPSKSFETVFEHVSNGRATAGIIPVENSLAGSIHRNYDLLLRNELIITGEYHLRVSHCLLCLPQVDLSQIKQVYSHPQALAQCESSLNNYGLEGIVEYDTAGSARLIKENSDLTSGAIASKHAAKVYGLKILKENFEDRPNNFTRFLIIKKMSPDKNEIHGDQKTSIVFSLDNSPGVLHKALSYFADRNIDLSKIESRPLVGKLWEYYFYVDFIGHRSYPDCEAALVDLTEISPFLRILGSYPRHKFD